LAITVVVCIHRAGFRLSTGTTDKCKQQIDLIDWCCNVDCASIQKMPRLLIACQDGYLYVYTFDPVTGGECSLLKQHR